VAGLAVAIAWIAYMTLSVGLRSDLTSPMVGVPLALISVGGAICFWFVARSGARGLPHAVRVLQVFLILAPVGFVLSVLPALLSAPRAPFRWGPAISCGAYAVQMAVVPLIVAAAIFRRTMVGSALWRGALIGALCGLSAALAIHAHCGMPEVMHVLLSHGLPIALGALLGALLGVVGGRA